MLTAFREPQVDMGDDSAYWEVADDFEAQEPVAAQQSAPDTGPVNVKRHVFMM